MAKIGVSKLYAATYVNTAGTISYTGVEKLADVTKVDVNIDSSGDNILFADNGPCESDSAFAGGKIKPTVADIAQDKMALLMGITPTTRTVGGATVNELIYDDNRNPPDLGVGFVVKKQVHGQLKWRAIVLKRVKFGVPPISVETQGKTISFQTEELEGTIMRDDSSSGAWMADATLDDEAKAVAYIEAVLS